MKKTLVLVSILALTGAVLGQGTVNFQTTGGGVSAQVLKVDGTPAGPDYWAQLYAGADAGSLVAAGSPVAFRQTAAGVDTGYVAAGTVALPGIAPGGAAFVQLRAWANASGASYELAAGNPVGVIGSSPVLFLSETGGGGSPPGLPVNLVGLQGFQMIVVPEPTTWALLLLGLGALALRRRK